MNQNQIKRYVACPVHNGIPGPLHKGGCVVLLNGNHWVAVQRRGPELHVMDSIVSTWPTWFTKWLNSHGLRIKRNQRKLQRQSSKLCGVLCILFIKMQISIPAFEKLFVDNNDRRIMALFHFIV